MSLFLLHFTDHIGRPVAVPPQTSAHLIHQLLRSGQSCPAEGVVKYKLFTANHTADVLLAQLRGEPNDPNLGALRFLDQNDTILPLTGQVINSFMEQLHYIGQEPRQDMGAFLRTLANETPQAALERVRRAPNRPAGVSQYSQGPELLNKVQV
ncbi:hypothetical protein OEA41_003625 [Lepraria neglecta]|uniref:Uncharacterized protein n=1 Tax=Lepraria neglecta TaxID=209136 RepID=A0AAD9Z506_9LECA|nr:hypothetical protein OEA41_003625 [Lepraria neglecta]